VEALSRVEGTACAAGHGVVPFGYWDVLS
jgi:hypothetical protein